MARQITARQYAAVRRYQLGQITPAALQKAFGGISFGGVCQLIGVRALNAELPAEVARSARK